MSKRVEEKSLYYYKIFLLVQFNICVIAKQNAHSQIVLRLKKFGMFELTTYHFVKGGQNTARN